MTNSAYNYASRLKKNNNKGPLGLDELFDTNKQVTKKVNLLYEYLSKSNNTIIHTGAGVSTGSGIPDFRGPSGIWTVMNNTNTKHDKAKDTNCREKQNEQYGPLTKSKKRRKLTDSACIPSMNNTSPGQADSCDIPEKESTACYTDTLKNEETNLEHEKDEETGVEKEDNDYVYYGNNKRKIVEFILALPSESHLCLLELLRRKKIRYIITQNVDGLHAVSGIPFDKLSELHGNVFVQRCLFCHKRYQRNYVSPTISFKPTGDLCGLCTFPPLNVLTDVVLDWFDCYEQYYEETSKLKSESSDLHVVMGSSLHIEPACHYASNDYHRKYDSPLIIINYQSTKLDPECDLIIHEDINKICTNLLKKFNLKVPTFFKKSHLFILKYNHTANVTTKTNEQNIRLVVIMKSSCIKSVEFLSDSAEYRPKCNIHVINKLQGVYKITIKETIRLKLTLFHDTELYFEIPYERIVLFKGEIWELDICATNGRRLVKSSKTFYNPDYYDHSSNSYRDSPEKHEKSSLIGNGVNLINIEKMVVYFNSNLYQEKQLPFRLVGYLDLIRKHNNFTEVKLNKSLTVLSYLWYHKFIQQHQYHLEPKQEDGKYSKRRYRESDYELRKTGNFTLYKMEESFLTSPNLDMNTLDYEETKNLKIKFENLTEDSYEKVLNMSESYSFGDEKMEFEKRNGMKSSDSSESTFDEPHNPNSYNSFNSKEYNNLVAMLENYYDNYIINTNTVSESGNTTDNRTNRRINMWDEIFNSSKFNKIILNKCIKLKWINMSNNKIIMNKRVDISDFMLSVKSSLPLKLFVVDNYQLGQLLTEIPAHLQQNNYNYKLFKFNTLYEFYTNSAPCGMYNASGLEDEDAEQMKSINVFELLVFNTINYILKLNTLDSYYYSNSHNIGEDKIEHYVIIKLFHQFLPLWIIKYLSDLFECR
ncbi:sir2-like histone deacetylase, putative [Theileria annulata]|uniref:Sir2-like histone deacetylase, putative n=1 Tax=Theileria annulata TaxID=5874 RepID=Q4UH74_THEAN|nr:sir2-like histone deacetylase, putative [Theileria annulata]CAI73565.1 sir2-like histone deacetylase, putative [Theileria annulata]|eukprot:XP_954242.1 sir2-like histone deacetylase, putative [Theileria annulata]